jgi:hypothetical protein
MLDDVPMDLVTDDVLAQLGFRDAAGRARARAALVEAGLTNAKKMRIAEAKLARVRAALADRFAIVCARASCRASAPPDRIVVDAAKPTDCTICRGSSNQREVGRAVEALAGGGLRRVVVIGGSPSTHEELRSLVDDRLELRLVAGTDRRTSRDASADLAWADLVVVWGGTELDHKVSKLYTDAKLPTVVTCPRRGIAALAETMIAAAGRRVS